MRRLVYLALDVGLVAVAAVLALVLRDNLELAPARLAALWPYAALSCAVALVVFPALGLHRTIWRLSAMADYNRVALAAPLAVGIAVAVGFALNRLEGIARAVPVLQALLAVVLMVGARLVARQRHVLRERPRQLVAALPSAAGEHLLVMGLTRLTDAFLRAIPELGGGRARVVGLLAGQDRHVGRVVGEHPVLGRPEDLAHVLRELEVHGVRVDRIVVTVRFEDLSEAVRAALLELEKTTAIRVDFLAELMGLGAGRGGGARDAAAASAEPPAMAFTFAADRLEALARRRYWRLKRALDMGLALAAGIVALPVGLACGALLALEIGGPVIFWQQRPGLGGRPFRLYKLRTMSSAHDPEGRLRSDAERLSRVGSLLRRTRLDELPQLYNILTGDMSFVGPRPLLPADQSAAHAARLLVRPGLTGWAQVTGGRTIAADDKAALDVWYVQNASLRLDLRILARTAPMVLRGERVEDGAILRAWGELRAAGICPALDTADPAWRGKPAAGG